LFKKKSICMRKTAKNTINCGRTAPFASQSAGRSSVGAALSRIPVARTEHERAFQRVTTFFLHF
jgi:hypothetical protein